MSTREARTRANAAWRSRTPAKPVQVYVHADTLAKLDALVVERGARGRAEVLTALIEAAYAPVPVPEPVATPERPAEPAAGALRPEHVSVPVRPRKRTKAPRAREREEIKRDLRRAARHCAKAGDEAGRREAAAAWWTYATPSEKRDAPGWLRLPV